MLITPATCTNGYALDSSEERLSFLIKLGAFKARQMEGVEIEDSTRFSITSVL